MKDKRQGNDLKVAWSIFKKDGEPFRLEGLDVSLYLKNMFGRKELNDFVVTGNIIQWTFYGKDQKNSGKYSLEMVINEGEKGMITTDKCDFVNLVACSCKLQGGEDAPNVETESIELTSTLEYVAGGSVVVDTELSETSENPVQNKVVTLALKNKQGLQYATERTVYLTRVEERIVGEKINEYEVEDVTEEQRAYNRETITLDNEVLVLNGQFFEVYWFSDSYSQYSNVAATNGVCVYSTITIFDTGEAVGVLDIETFGLTFSVERTLYYPEEEGKELTEEEKNYNKETYELIYNGPNVTINVDGRFLAIIGSLGNRLFAVVHEANYKIFIELYHDGSIKILHDLLNFSYGSEQSIKAQLYDLMLYLMMGFSYPTILEDSHYFCKVDEVEITGQGVILGYNKGQSRVNIIYDFVNDTLEIKEINMSGGSQSDFNLSFSKDF